MAGSTFSCRFTEMYSKVWRFSTLILLSRAFLQLTMLIEPKDDDFDAVVKRPQLATTHRRKSLQMADDLIEHMSEEDHLMHGCLKLEQGVKSITASYREEYNMQT
jgi:hypothetical protein